MLVHGLKRDYRRKVMQDMLAFSRRLVMIVDCFPNRSLPSSLVQRLEGSCYREFLLDFGDDLGACYRRTTSLNGFPTALPSKRATTR